MGTLAVVLLEPDYSVVQEPQLFAALANRTCILWA